MPTNSSADRITLLLAASGLTDRAIFDGLKELEALGPSAATRRVRIMRQLIGQSRNLLQEEYGVDQPYSNDERETIVSKVMQLLVVEGQLAPSLAAERLQQALTENRADKQEVPQIRAKEGLRAWLRRVAAQVPSSELLHHASRVRNSLVHAGTVDWPLRTRE